MYYERFCVMPNWCLPYRVKSQFISLSTLRDSTCVEEQQRLLLAVPSALFGLTTDKHSQVNPHSSDLPEDNRAEEGEHGVIKIK